MTKDEIRRDVMRHIKAHNKYMEDSYLEQLSFRHLMCEVHPLYRDYFEDQFKKVIK